MIIAAIIGIVIGYLIAIPPGPVGMAAIRTGIRHGWHASLRLAAGAGLFDILYCAGAMLATSAIVGQLKVLESSSPVITVCIQLAIVGVIIVFGIIQMREKHPEFLDKDVLEGRNAPPKPRPALPTIKAHWLGADFIKRIKRNGPFFIGIGFAIANLANPAFVPSLAALSAFIQKIEIFPDTFVNAIVFAVGFGLGNMLWLATLSKIIIMNREKMTPTFIKRIQQVSGATLISFGTIYGLRILAITKWTDIYRLVFAF
ncbi:MAG: LysE family transporter [Ignavibacteria bacterium]|nr:LysE family transporter [Ignavibacteria bacterium]